jgi:RNA polymerase sigma factor (sigma-70 family)
MTTAELGYRSSAIADENTGLDELVELARTGDGAAWSEIVRRFDDSIRRVVRAHGVDAPTARDLVQQTWLTAVAQLGAVRSADSLGGWLRTIARRECRRTVARRRRELAQQWKYHFVADSENQELELSSDHPTPEDEALRAERRALLRVAWLNLPERDRTLLSLLMDEPRRPYVEISRDTGLPIGSIGPTRARSLARLRAQLAALGIDHL